MLYLTNAAPLKRARAPKTTTDAGFVAKYFHIPDFLKFSPNEKPTEPSIRTLELPQKSFLSKVLDSINIFKKDKPFGEPYLRAYIQPDGSYKWYFVYPGQMLYPAPDEFSFDTINQTLHKTTPTTTTTTTTTTEPPPEELDETPKPLYPLMGKIEFIKNETEPKEKKWAVTMSDSGPIFQPYGKIQPPFDEPLLQQLQSDDQVEQEPQEEPEQENQSVTRRKHRKHTRTPKPIEEEEEPPAVQPEAEEPVEDDQVADEPQDEAQQDNPTEYDNAEQDEKEPSAEENNPDEEDEPQNEDEQTVEEEASQDDKPASSVTKVTSLKPSAT